MLTNKKLNLESTEYENIQDQVCPTLSAKGQCECRFSGRFSRTKSQAHSHEYPLQNAPHCFCEACDKLQKDFSLLPGMGFV